MILSKFEVTLEQQKSLYYSKYTPNLPQPFLVKNHSKFRVYLEQLRDFYLVLIFFCKNFVLQKLSRYFPSKFSFKKSKPNVVIFVLREIESKFK